MILYYIWVAVSNNLAKLCDHFRFIIGTAGLERRSKPAAIANSNEEDTSTVGVKRGRF